MIMADPVIYGPAFSTYVRSVLLTLEEKGAPYRLEEITLSTVWQCTACSSTGELCPDVRALG